VGIPDPNAKIFDSPPATNVLAPQTALVIGGDWNEDELSNGRKGPAEWIRDAASAVGTDGTDRDRSNSVYDDARNACNPSDRSTQSSSKLDYLLWQDSIATLANQFVFNSASIAGGCSGGFPLELLFFPSSPSVVSTLASDHRPVVVDLELPVNAVAPPTRAQPATLSGGVTRERQP
jgi:endonuclease/exonuclease/phosphatase family metal-dependent hydrolase